MLVTGDEVMIASTHLFSSQASRGERRERWLRLRDLLGGALLLTAWLALWTVTWAAIAGPLAPVERPGAPAATASAQM
jgi:hypothetical protein